MMRERHARNAKWHLSVARILIGFKVAELAREVFDPVLQVVDGSIHVAIHVAVDST